MSFNTDRLIGNLIIPFFPQERLLILLPGAQSSDFIKTCRTVDILPRRFLPLVIYDHLLTTYLFFKKTFNKHQQTHRFFLVAPSKALELGRRYGLWFGWCWRWGCSCGSAEEWFVWWDFFTGRELNCAWMELVQVRGDKLSTLPETNSSPLKMDGWNTTILLGRPIFRGELLVSGRVPLTLDMGLQK